MQDEDDDQYLDNQDDDVEADDQDDPTGNEPIDQPERRGDPTVALRQEREKRRAMEARVEALEKENARAFAMMEAQRRPEPPRDLAAERQQLAERLIDAPDEVLRERDAYLRQQMQTDLDPLMVDSAKQWIQSNPEWAAAYQHSEVKSLIDPVIDHFVVNTGRVDRAALKDLFDQPIVKAFGNRPKTDNGGAKQRLASTVTGGRSGMKDTQESILENASKAHDALFKTDPRRANRLYLEAVEKAKNLQR
jgi:hypothetical protein